MLPLTVLPLKPPVRGGGLPRPRVPGRVEENRGNLTWWTFRIFFIFFCSGARERGEESEEVGRCGRFFISGLQKGQAGKGPLQKNVKNRQKASKSFSTLFDNFRAGQKSSKSVKNIFDIFRQFSRGTSFLAPFGGL